MWLFQFIRFIGWIPMRILYPTKIIGTAKLPKGKVILSINHQCTADILIVSTRTSRPLCFLARKEIFKKGFLNWFFTTMKVIRVERNGNDFVAMKKVIECLKDDYVVGLFPEGTRCKDEVFMKELKNGVGLFALKAEAPVIPMVFWRKPKLFRMNYLMIGEAMEFNEFYDKKVSTEVVNEVTSILQEKMFAMKAQLVAECGTKA